MWWAREVNPISGDCFASSAIRCCRVDTVSGFDAPAMFPSNDSATRHSLPSPGSPRCQFPCFHGTMECSDVLRPSHRTRLPSPGDTMRRGLCVCSQRSRSPDRGPGVRHPVPSTGNGAHGGVQDLPGSWGTLMLLCRVLRPRRDRCVRRLDVIGAAPAMSTTKAPTTTYLSGLNGTASELAVYASCGRLPGQHATLASGCWPALPGGIDDPQGSNERFQLCILTSLPPFPSLAWRKDSRRFQSELRPAFHVAGVKTGIVLAAHGLLNCHRFLLGF